MAKKPQQRIPKVGDNVIPGTSKSAWRVWQVSDDGSEVNVEIPGTNLNRYRVPVRDLTWVEEE